MPAADQAVDARGPSPMESDSDDVCWICLDDKALGGHSLFSPCKCPRKVHPKCLARWQLQQAGRPEETHCRFCNSTLADWKTSLTPDNLKPAVKDVQPIMVVYFEGEIHRIPVKQGPDGLTEFTSRIRELFRLPDEVDISLTFGCKEPMSGDHLKLEGIGAFDAAVHCASVAAADRQSKLRSNSFSNLAALVGGTASSSDGSGPPAPALPQQSRSFPGSAPSASSSADSSAPAAAQPEGSPTAGGRAFQSWRSIAHQQLTSASQPPPPPQQQHFGQQYDASPSPHSAAAAAPHPFRDSPFQLSADSLQPASPSASRAGHARLSPHQSAAPLSHPSSSPPPRLQTATGTPTREPGAVARRARAYSAASARASEQLRSAGPSFEGPGTPPGMPPPRGLFSALSRSGRSADHLTPPAAAATSYARGAPPAPAAAHSSVTPPARTRLAPSAAAPLPHAWRSATLPSFLPPSPSSSPAVPGPLPHSSSLPASLPAPLSAAEAMAQAAARHAAGPAASPSGYMEESYNADDGDVERRAVRRMRRSSSRVGERDEPQLSPSQGGGLEATAVAVGSLTGRLKCTLKAFSRKVARSLNFNNKGDGFELGSATSASSSPRSAQGLVAPRSAHASFMQGGQVPVQHSL